MARETARKVCAVITFNSLCEIPRFFLLYSVIWAYFIFKICGVASVVSNMHLKYMFPPKSRGGIVILCFVGCGCAMTLNSDGVS